MHSALIVWTSFWFTATPAALSDFPTPPALTPAVIDQLGSNRYAVRQAAMEQLWAAGDAAIPLLEEALRSKSAEIRYRAQYVLDNLRSGITHDTPPAVLRDIHRFRSDLVEQRRQAMQRLEASGRPRIVLSLLQYETDPRLREEWSRALERSLIRSIVAGQLDEVTETLRQNTTSDVWHRHWAAFAFQRGILDAELVRRAAGESERDPKRQRVFLLRANGQLSEAARLASELSEELHFALLGELRDWATAAPLVAARLDSESSPTDFMAERLALAAAYYRLAGKEQESNRHLAMMKSQAKEILNHLSRVDPNYHQQQRELTNRNWHFAKGLLLNGRYDEAIELMRSRQAPFVFELLCEQHRFEEAFAGVGARLMNGPDVEWFRRVAMESASSQEAVDQRLTVALIAVRQLAFLGRRDEALSSLNILLNDARADRNTRRLRMIAETAVKLSATDLALEVTVLVLQKEDSANALALTYPSRSGMATMWWEFFRGTQTHESISETLRRVDRLVYPPKTARIEIGELIADASTWAAKLEDAKRLKCWHELAETCRLYGREELAIHFYKKAASGSLDDALRLADVLASQEKWAEAAEAYNAAWRFNQDRALPLYLSGRALQRSGDPDKGKRLAELALLMPMGNAEMRHEFAGGLKERGYREEARQQYELILRTADFQDGRLVDAAKQVGNLVHATDALRAADCWETMLLSCLKPHWVFVEKGGYIQIPHLVHKTRARGLLKAGKSELALKEVWASFQAAPANSELAEEFVPLLEAANRHQDANELFQRSYERLRQLSEAFPQCATFHHNMAWLHARCDRDLDEALKHVQRALELEPNRTSFVDTLGEVHFRLGHYQQAMVCAERCLKAEPRNAHYQAQLERFSNAIKDNQN